MSFLDTLWDDVKALVTKDAAYVESAVETVWKNEVADVGPIVTEGLTTFVSNIATNPTAAGVASAAGAAWAGIASKLEGTAITTGISTLVTAVNTGIAGAVAAATVPAPAPTPEPVIVEPTA